MSESLYKVIYSNIGVEKINIIKLIHEFTGQDLKESKEVVESLTPITDLTKEEAEELCNKLNALGAQACIEKQVKSTSYSVLLVSYDKDRREDMRICLTKEYGISDHTEAYAILDSIDNGEEYVLADDIENIYEARGIGEPAKYAGGIIDIKIV